MKINQWTLGLAAVGVVSLASVVQAEEKPLQPLQTAVSGTSLSGYVDTSAQWNLGTGNANNPGYAFGGGAKADGFNLNAAVATLEKKLDPQDNLAAGYKLQLAWGQDAAAQTGNTAPVKQAYVNLRLPLDPAGLELKIGRFDGILGYEVFESGNNMNYTRSYGYSIEPTEHTGVLAAYRINDIVAVSAGVANTVDALGVRSAIAESYKTYMGAVYLTAPKEFGFLEGSTLTMGMVSGSVGGNPVGQENYYIGAMFNTPIAELKIGASYDYRGNDREGAFDAQYVNAAAFYTSYKVTENITLHNRAEYATCGTGPGTPLMPTRLFADTFTVQFDYWKNVISRVEFRWDRDLTGRGIYGRLGNQLNACMLAGNVIYKF